ncbi:MAG: copper chaperone PCu(A)C [bacterium]|jgi:periplasmic copper chaperone A|nr:copper chaperone PCu(A)C [bacterium]
MDQIGKGASGILVLVLCWVVGCGSDPGNQVVVEGVWVRQNIPPQRTTAGYLVIRNAGSATALESATTAVAEVTELHRVSAREDVMYMRKVDRLPIPEGGVATLQPGGNHLMLIGLKRDLVPGEKVDILLRFINGQAVTVSAEVKPVGESK